MTFTLTPRSNVLLNSPLTTNGNDKDCNAAIHLGLDDASYRKLDGMSYSDLKLVAEKTPIHLLQKLHGPQVPPTPAVRAAWDVGTAVHCAILEPDRWRVAEKPSEVESGGFITRPLETMGRTKIATEAYSQWRQALPPGVIVLTNEQVQQANSIASAVITHPIASVLLERLICSEISLQFQRKRAPKVGRCRLDAVVSSVEDDGSVILVDLKTAVDASLEGWKKSIANFRYHMQASYYIEGFQQCFSDKIRDWLWIVVEKTPPYAVAVHSADELLLDRGDLDINTSGERWEALQLAMNGRAAIDCLDDSKFCQFHGYPLEIQSATLPNWF